MESMQVDLQVLTMEMRIKAMETEMETVTETVKSKLEAMVITLVELAMGMLTETRIMDQEMEVETVMETLILELIMHQSTVNQPDLNSPQMPTTMPLSIF